MELIKNNFRDVRGKQYLTVFLILIRTGCSLLSIYYVQKLLDSMINKDFTNSLYILKILSLVVVAYFILLFLSQYFLRQLFFLGNFSLMKSVYSKFLKKDFKDFSEINSGKVLSKITNDSTKISDWYSQGKVIIVTQSLILLSTLMFMFYYNVLITVVVFTITLICFFIVKKLGEKVSSLTKEDQKQVAATTSYILQSLNGIFDIKQLSKEKYFIKYLVDIIEKRKKLNKNMARYFSLYVGISATVAFILPILSIIMSSYFILENKFSIGSAIAMYTFSKMLDEPIRSISTQISTYETSKKIEKNILELIDFNKIESVGQMLEPFNKLDINIESFSFDEHSPKILENLNVKIDKGDLVLVKGKSGVGKTTLANLIMNKLSKSSVLKGEISWNGRRVTDEDNTYSQILKASQNPFLYEESIEENILLGEVELRDRFEEVACCVGVDEILKEKGKGYVLKENGENLSGGQKHRIELARILIRRPSFLILDEPTSALNKNLSEKVAKNISDYLKKYNITCLVITHSDEFEKYATKKIELG